MIKKGNRRLMTKILVYYAHPGEKYSRVNSKMAAVAKECSYVTYVDLYAEYPRFVIDVDKEQQRLLDHDIIIFQHPVFWYSTPAIVKEWFDLVLEYGFAYGTGGDKLKGKYMMNAVTAAGSKDAYSESGFQNFRLRTFFTPLEQTARLCQMSYLAPFVLYSSLAADEDKEIKEHIIAYKELLQLLHNGAFDLKKAVSLETIERHEIESLKIGKGC